MTSTFLSDEYCLPLKTCCNSKDADGFGDAHLPFKPARCRLVQRVHFISGFAFTDTDDRWDSVT